MATGARTKSQDLSALTGYLAANNISARQIRDSASTRRDAAATQNATVNQAAGVTLPTRRRTRQSNGQAEESESDSKQASKKRQSDDDDSEEASDSSDIASLSRSAKKKQKAESKKNALSKKQQKAKHDPDASTDDEKIDEKSIRRALRHTVKKAGQLANCEVCDKRFTVTAYTKAGPEGGLLCLDCGKIMDPKKTAKLEKKMTKPKGQVGKQEAMALDDIQTRGTKSLTALCLDTIIENVGSLEDLGAMPDALKNKINRILCREREFKSTTLDLFLRDDPVDLKLWDCAYLKPEDFIKVFTFCPSLRFLCLRNANQLQDGVVDYVVTRKLTIEELSIYGPNLLHHQHWIKLFDALGTRLKKLKFASARENVTSATLQHISVACPNIEHLSLRSLFESLDYDCVRSLANLGKLKNLSLEFTQDDDIDTEAIVELIKAVGPNLTKLSLKALRWAGNEVLQAIHQHCENLTHLAMTENETCTDEGFADLFTNWTNRPLIQINFGRCRHLLSNEPVENSLGIGMCDKGFQAMWKHSSTFLESLDVRDARHISTETFHAAFDPAGAFSYPKLRQMDVSFTKFDQLALYRAFTTAAMLKEVMVFGLYNIRHPAIPYGVKVLGIVGEKIEVQGNASLDELLNAANELEKEYLAVEVNGATMADSDEDSEMDVDD
ncbi:MAG: hypothetical protein M1814_001048 [Vezdaea aestivalis]|nr:MAG: hypothetical protein M1814_001048 [Vezdaea aestivalis]